MNLNPRSPRFSRCQSASRLVWTVGLALWLGGQAYAQLLIERHQGGPHQYNGDPGPKMAEMTFLEPVRITGITGWINGFGPSSISLLAAAHDDEPAFQLFSKNFTVESVPGTPAKWQGISSLKWDVPAGTYDVLFPELTMPYALGYFGPVSSAPPPDVMLSFYDGEWHLTGGEFGVRVYGMPLSAVPEPATYGLVGVIGLAALIYRRQQRAAV